MPISFVGCAVLALALAGCGTNGKPGDTNHHDTTVPNDTSGHSIITDTNPTDSSAKGDTSTTHDTSATAANELAFAVVGDTRPPNEDDSTHYPTQIITDIYRDVENESPHPMFVLATGDYMYATPTGTSGQTQLNDYMGARDLYNGPVYATMGNHECTGYTDSNCGQGNADGITKNYTEFMNTFLQPMGITKPYYEENLSAGDGSWTAKIVVIAANAWDNAQASWLQGVMAQQTTYTFILRHEHDYAHTAPGVDPSAAIFNNYPYTLLICGHSHEYKHYASAREIIVGNGGAPLTSSTNYGYVTVVRQPSNGYLMVTSYDYHTHAIVDQFRIQPNGSRG